MDKSASPSDAYPFPRDAAQPVCPHCRSANVLALGRVRADRMGIRSEYHCRECAKEFWPLSKERRIGEDPGDPETFQHA